MIVGCPSCATRFRIDAAVLGPSGRKLKCSRCAHQWFEGAPEEQAEPEVAEAPPVVEPEPAPEPPPRAPKSESFEAPPRRRTRRTPNLPARTKPRRRRGGGLGWGLATVMAALVIAVLSFGREQLVSFYPPAGDVYAALGFSDPAPGDGLELREIVPSRAEEGGVAYLVLDGTVVNVTDEILSVPEMTAVVRDEQSAALQQWTFRADVVALQPGESAAFKTRLAAPADGATDVKIEFADGVVEE